MKVYRLLLGSSLALAASLWLACGRGTVGGAIQIVEVSVARDSVVVDTIAQNTGTRDHQFPIGCSLKHSDGTWHDIAHQMQSIGAGESREVRFTAEAIDPRGFVLVRAAIWNSESSDGRLEGRYDMDERDLR